jgi:hypothetical protein
MQGIVGDVLLAAFEAHVCLAQIASLDVIAAEVPGALGALALRLMRTAFDLALHGRHATRGF